MSEIALKGHEHTCPLTEPSAHVGGPIEMTQSLVRVNGRYVAVVGDKAICTGVGAMDPIAAGSKVVRIAGHAVARKGDPTEHGGRIVEGAAFFTVG